MPDPKNKGQADDPITAIAPHEALEYDERNIVSQRNLNISNSLRKRGYFVHEVKNSKGDIDHLIVGSVMPTLITWKVQG